ncbi:MAG: hypothetical protein ACOYT8_00920 [Candidatus Dependentiae bacterium]
MTLPKTSARTRIRKAQTPSLILFQQDLHHIATFVALLRQIDRPSKQTKKVEPYELHKAWLKSGPYVLKDDVLKLHYTNNTMIMVCLF